MTSPDSQSGVNLWANSEDVEGAVLDVADVVAGAGAGADAGGAEGNGAAHCPDAAMPTAISAGPIRDHPNLRAAAAMERMGRAKLFPELLMAKIVKGFDFSWKYRRGIARAEIMTVIWQRKGTPFHSRKSREKIN